MLTESSKDFLRSSLDSLGENIEINGMKRSVEKIKKKVNSQNEIACIHAIDTLFKKIDDLDFLNKRAVFVYLRDISGLTPKQLSVSMSNIRKYYRDIQKTNKAHYSFSIFLED